MSQDAPLHHRFGDYCLSPEGLWLSYRGRRLSVAPRVAKTLVVLVEHAGDFVAKEDLMQAVWGGAAVEEANLTQNIYTLRRLFASTSGENLIENLPKRGYRFTGSLQAARAVRPTPALAIRPAALPVAAIVLILAATMYAGMSHRPAHRERELPSAALNAYALGWYYWHGFSEGDLKESIANFRSVVAAAPDNPAGYAGEAVASAKLADIWSGSPSGVISAANAEKLAQRAVALDPESARARAARGFVEFDIDGLTTAASADLAYAVQRDPDLAVAHAWYGFVLLWQGNLTSARAELERASSLDPTLPEVDYALGLDDYMSRDYPDAVAHATLSLDAASATPADTPMTVEAKLLLAAAHEQLKQYRQALLDVRDLARDPDSALAAGSIRAQAYASMGQWRQAQRELAQVERLAERDGARPFLVALAHAALKQPAQAFAWLSKMMRVDRVLFSLDPRLDSLRSDERFQRWVRG
jgi:DNA-binding winged helix-turn-helix (wHTH) protein/Tfp pilus assembly protein PilF